MSGFYHHHKKYLLRNCTLFLFLIFSQFSLCSSSLNGTISCNDRVNGSTYSLSETHYYRFIVSDNTEGPYSVKIDSCHTEYSYDLYIYDNMF